MSLRSASGFIPPQQVEVKVKAEVEVERLRIGGWKLEARG